MLKFFLNFVVIDSILCSAVKLLISIIISYV